MDGDTKAQRAVHVLVDLENNQPTLAEVRALVPDLTDVGLFHSGALQACAGTGRSRRRVGPRFFLLQQRRVMREQMRFAALDDEVAKRLRGG